MPLAINSVMVCAIVPRVSPTMTVRSNTTPRVASCRAMNAAFFSKTRPPSTSSPVTTTAARTVAAFMALTCV